MAMFEKHTESQTKSALMEKPTGPTAIELAFKKAEERKGKVESKRSFLEEIEKSIASETILWMEKMGKERHKARDGARKDLALKIITGCQAVRNNVHLSAVVPLLNAGILKESDDGKIKGWDNKHYSVVLGDPGHKNAVAKALSDLISRANPSSEVNKLARQELKSSELLRGLRGIYSFMYSEKLGVSETIIIESDGERIYPTNSNGSQKNTINEMKKENVFLLVDQLKKSWLDTKITSRKRRWYAVQFHKWLRAAIR